MDHPHLPLPPVMENNVRTLFIGANMLIEMLRLAPHSVVSDQIKMLDGELQQFSYCLIHKVHADNVILFLMLYNKLIGLAKTCPHTFIVRQLQSHIEKYTDPFNAIQKKLVVKVKEDSSEVTWTE